MEKAGGSPDKEPLEMQGSGHETMKCPGLDHPGQNKEEQPKHDESIIR